MAEESLGLALGAHYWHALMLVHGWLMSLELARETDAGGTVTDGARSTQVRAYAFVAHKVLL